MPRKFSPKGHSPAAKRFIGRAEKFVEMHGEKFNSARISSGKKLHEIMDSMMKKNQGFQEIESLTMGADNKKAGRIIKYFEENKSAIAEIQLQKALLEFPDYIHPFFLTELKKNIGGLYESNRLNLKIYRQKPTYGVAIRQKLLNELLLQVERQLGNWHPKWPE